MGEERVRLLTSAATRNAKTMDAQTHWAISQMERYRRSGNFAAVVEIGERVLARDDRDMATFLFAASSLAAAYERLERWDVSLRWHRRCLTIEPASPVLQAGYGRVLMRMGKVAEAATVFSDLALRHPNHSGYHGGAGSCLLRLGDLKGALPYLKRARELDPANPYVLNDLASAYLLDGDFESSLSAFKQAIEYLTDNDRELALDIRASIEEVRAALVLRQRGVDQPPPARVAEVCEVYPEREAADRQNTETRNARARQTGVAHAFGESKVREMVLQTLAGWGSRPRQILGALSLWSEFLESLPREEIARVDRRTKFWTAAVVYAVGRLDGERWAVQRDVAREFGISTAALSSCFVRLRRTLDIEVGDPRYCTVPNRRRSALIEQIHRGRLAHERLLL